VTKLLDRIVLRT